MKIEHFTSGTGITRKRKIRRTARSLEETNELLAEPSPTYLEYLAIIEGQAARHLGKKGLPTERATGYRKIGSRWQKVNKPPHFCSRTVIFEKEGYEEDSAVGFSARIIELASYLRASLSAGRVERALDYAHEIGVLVTEAKFKRRWEALALRGEMQRERSKDGAAKTNGRRAGAHQSWKAVATEIVRSHETQGLPTPKGTRLARLVISKLKLTKHAKTVKRAIEKEDVR